MFALISVCVLGVILLFIGSCFSFFNLTFGIVFIVLGVLAIGLILTWYLVKKSAEEKRKREQRQLREEQKNNFNEWLELSGFETTKEIGDFLVDTENKKWCKYLNEKIYEFSDIINAKVQKHSSRTTTNSGTRTRSSSSSHSTTGHSGVFFTNTHKSRGRESSTSTTDFKSRGVSRDTSTYDVHITTKLLEEPLVVIPCGTSAALADRLCAAIDIMLDKKKTRKKADSKDDN